MFKRYLQYLKDNPNHLWFKRKLYGWGWVPVRWQGWLVTVAFIAFAVWNAISLGPEESVTDSELKLFFAKLILAAILLIAVAYKTGEKPKWQWGIPEN